MPCGSCSQRSAQQQLNNQQLRVQTPQPQDCDYTGTLLQNWLNSLNCVKLAHKEVLIGVTTPQANMYLGYIQSAINYPDNYCYYALQLQEFQFNILPRIIAHVPECINQ